MKKFDTMKELSKYLIKTKGWCKSREGNKVLIVDEDTKKSIEFITVTWIKEG